MTRRYGRWLVLALGAGFFASSCAGHSDGADGEATAGLGGASSGAGRAGTSSGGATAGGHAGQVTNGSAGADTAGESGRGGSAAAVGGAAGHGGEPTPGTAGHGGDPTPGMAGEGGVPGHDGDYACTMFSANVESCEGLYGFLHRPLAATCEAAARDETIADLPPEDVIVNRWGTDWIDECKPGYSCRVAANECAVDADCGPSAMCFRYIQYDEGDEILRTCEPVCETDADCDAGTVCACDYLVQNRTRERISVGRCVEADCTLDSDCGTGRYCAGPHYRVGSDAEYEGPSAILSFHCQKHGDECLRGDDCERPPSREGDPYWCSYAANADNTGHFYCDWDD